ncbi:Uncharacterised protein [Chryseobacterium indoltheticum]|uniref:Uncharacterized protein n=1 Tax=Chryseobacterium indoltheticum TaxID=254 RepID=A0A381FRF8_9FLAO|nr:Uncharacterised protein [Chryseobacterium indoltheticum]
MLYQYHYDIYYDNFILILKNGLDMKSKPAFFKKAFVVEDLISMTKK